jgi:hypothetical protein
MTTTIETLTADLATARAAYRAAYSARVDAFGAGVHPAECALKAAAAAVKVAQAAVDAVTPAKVAAPVVAPVKVAAQRSNPWSVGDGRYDRRAHCEGSDDISYV